jgi:hypothetical protein
VTLDLKHTTRSVVENLRNTLLYRAIEEWSRKSAFEIREELGLASFSVTSSDSVEMYREIKKHILSQTVHDDETLKFLMDVPRWVGFNLDAEEFQSGQQVIGAAKDEAVSLLWLWVIPKVAIDPIAAPEDFASYDIKLFIQNLISSDESRSNLASQMAADMLHRGISDIVFRPNPIGRGYAIDASMTAQRLRSLIALVLMKSSGCPFDLDEVFTIDEEKLIEEITSYIIVMHAKTTLKNQITGGGSRKPFDWPLIGNLNIYGRLFSTLEVLRQSAAQMSTCSVFKNESDGEKKMWNEADFLSYLVQDIADHYTDTLRVRHGKGKNRELSLFIDLLNGERKEIAQRLADSGDRAAALAMELSIFIQRARTGEKPQITPERRFRVVLSSLKQRVEDDKLEDIQADEIIDKVNDAFDAIVGVVEHHKESLGEESERFTQALCFETSYRLLQLLKAGDAIMDIPWVSRFIAEESARTDITAGEISHLDDEHRIRRIVSAYAGGVTYLVLQFQNAPAS